MGEWSGKTSLASDHNALEDLDPFLVAFNDLRVDLDRVAHPESRYPLLQLGFLDCVQNDIAHGKPPAVNSKFQISPDK
jgi:hypothetical protein